MITKKAFVLNILKTLRNIHNTTKVASIHYIFPAECSKNNEVHISCYYITLMTKSNLLHYVLAMLHLQIPELLYNSVV